MDYLSYSSLKLLKDCPACFWWQIKKGIRRLNAWQSNLPNVIEKEILDNFDVYRENGKLPPEFEVKKFPELRGFKLIDKATHTKWKNPRNHEPKYNNLVANPDEAITDDKKVVIVDIKTVGSYSNNITEDSMLKNIDDYGYKSQLEFYTYILKMSGKEVEDYGYILFYYIGGMNKENELILKHNLVKVNLDVNNIPPLLEEAEKVLELESPPECRCEFCSSSEQRYKDCLKKQEDQEELMNNIINSETE